MNAQGEGESGREQVRWPNCGRNAFILAIAPFLPGLFVGLILLPLVLEPVFGCYGSSITIICPRNPVLSVISTVCTGAAMAFPLTLMVSIILYVVCRRKRIRTFGV